MSALKGLKKDLNVLIVDDSTFNIAMARIHVELFVKNNQPQIGEMTVNFTEAYDGIQAVEAYKKANSEGGTPFDVILMDYNMPNLDGIGATKKIFKLHQKLGCQPPKIIFCSAYSDTKYVLKAKEAGAIEFLVKPLKAEHVMTVF